MSMEGMRLTEAAQADRDDFERYSREYGGCSCFTGAAPCGHCTHPGNPYNQEDDSCWQPDEEDEPMKVTRYDPEMIRTDRWERASMEKSLDGDYVEFDDYETLRKERDAMAIYRDSGWQRAERLEADNEALRAEVRRLRAALREERDRIQAALL